VVPDEHTVASADGVTIAYDVCGAGAPALVFVHGWSGRRGHWDEQLDYFAANYSVVRIDLAGHGGSGVDRQRWTVAAFGDDVLAVCDALALDTVILVGHSLGGSVIVLAAQQLTDRVIGLIGIDTWSALGVRNTTEQTEASVLLPEMRADYEAGSRRFAQLMCGPTADPVVAARIADEVAGMPPHIAISILDVAIQEGPESIEQGLLALDVPLSSISSETFRPKDPGVLATFGIDNVVIPATGHYLMLEQPATFNRALATAVARSRG
jgi:pimeloyl-ACP methyl ester carboxylesterase